MSDAPRGGLALREFSVELRTPDGTIRPVDSVSIEVGSGERVALVGESGCGKSMMLRGLLRFIPTSVLERVTGVADYGGANLAELDDRALRAYRGHRIAMVFQDAMARLNPSMTIGEQVAEVRPERDRKRRDEQVVAVFRSVGLDSSAAFRRRYPHELSGGMRQRVLIAIALAGDPELLIADEPTTALDVTVQAQILDTITDVVKARGMSLLMVTHDLGVVAETCEHLYVMYAGQIVESGRVEDVFAQPRHPYTQGLLACVLDVLEVGTTEVRTIPGVVPAPGSIEHGCRFRSRCPSAHDRCEKDPPVIQIGPRSEVRCWLYADGDPVGATRDAAVGDD